MTIQESVGGQDKDVNFVDKYMSGTFDSVMACDEPESLDIGETPLEMTENFFKLNCHINVDTNHLHDGLTAGLHEKIEKRSESLGRDSVYTKTSRISRLPKHLAVHFVRFDWRRTTNKKAKIMRKVTFPRELDALEYCNESLREMLIPVRDKIRDLRKEEEDVERAQKRQKRIRNGEENDSQPVEKKDTAKAKKSSSEKTAAKEKKDAGKSADGDTEMEDVKFKTDAEWEAEKPP